MRRIATTLAAVAVLGAAALVGLTSSSRAGTWAAHPCRAFTLTATPSRPARHHSHCAANATPHVSVGHRALGIADLSDHAQVITFYGRGSVVRLAQRHGIMRVLAATTWPRARIHVWFTAYQH